MEEVVNNFTQSHPEIVAVNYRLILDTGYNMTSSPSNHSRQYIPSGRIIGIDWKDDFRINDLIVESGNFFNSSFTNSSILLEAHFARSYELDVGDFLLTQILGTKFYNFSIEAIVYSPEYLVIIPSKYDFLPTNSFGVIYYPLEKLQELTNLTGVANNIIVKMLPDITKESRNIIISELYTAINEVISSSFTSPVMQEYQISNWALRLDLEEISEIALVLPIIVLGVGAISIYITLSRTVQSQKRIIGIVSCLGYSQNDILMHFFFFSLIIGIIGSISGIVFGIIVSGGVTWIYAYYMGFPDVIDVKLQYPVIFIALITGIAISIISGLIPAWKASRMIPREALQSKSSTKKGSRSIFEKLLVINPLGLKLVIPIRNLFRKPFRSLATITMIAAAVMILVVSVAFIDSVNTSVLRQFNEISQYDIIVKYNGIKFADLGVKEDLKYLEELPGVESIDPVLQLPSTIISGEKEQQVLITAWNSSDPSSHNFNWESQEDSLKSNGSMVVGSALSLELNVQTGSEISFYYPRIPGLNWVKDFIELAWIQYKGNYNQARDHVIDVLYQRIASSKESLSFSTGTEGISYSTSDLMVSGVTNEIWGTIVYTTVETITSSLGLNYFRESVLNIDLSPYTQLILKITQPNNITLLEEIKEKASNLENVRTIEFGYDLQNSIDTTMSVFNAIIGTFLIFSCLLAATAIFTSIYINFQERQTEIATMLAIGLSDKEFLTILSIENLFQAILGILGGIPIGLWMASWILDNILRVFYFEISVLPFTWLILWISVIVVVLLSQIPAFYQGIKLDLASITKELSL
jgi:ABC-type lipoprotein release transport system permease subunit